jgi:acetoin utilization deacetylase AcuC-like enzyme
MVMPFFFALGQIRLTIIVERMMRKKFKQQFDFGRIRRRGKAMRTALTFVPGTTHTLQGHPEHAGRLSAVWALLEQRSVLDDLHHVPPIAATDRQLLAVHTDRHVDLIRWAAEQGGGMLGPDTYMKRGSYSEASLAAGSSCAVVDRVMRGEVDNGIALVRPPGHHAGTDSAEGFCLFNNVAVVARHLQSRYGLERIAILDFDVHHGNGTEQIFYNDPSVMFISTHILAPFFYPGTGRLGDMGVSRGLGYTINVPLQAGVGDTGYLALFEQMIRPKFDEFRPQFILVSAGFDAHWRDPLASAALSLTGYAQLCRGLIDSADELCDGKIAFILEGGYFLDALSQGVLNLIYALQKRDLIVDELGPALQSECDISDLLLQLQRRHLLV